MVKDYSRLQVGPNWRLAYDATGKLVFQYRGVTQGDLGTTGNLDVKALKDAVFLDSYNTIQAALNEAAQAVPVIVPPGTFESDSKPTIVSNDKITGWGSHCGIKLADGINDSVIEIGTDASNFELSNFAIDGNKANNPTGLHGIYAPNSSLASRIRKLYIHDCKEDGIRLQPGAGSSLRRIWIEFCNIIDNDYDGIQLITAYDSFCIGNYAVGNGFDGILFSSAGNRNIIGYNNGLDNGRYGIHLSLFEFEVSHNNTYNNTENGIYLSGCTYGHVIGNQANGNIRSGIMLNACHHVYVLSNECNDNGVGYPGIYLYGATLYCYLYYNIACRFFAWPQAYGIYIVAAAHDNEIMYNTCIDNNTNEILDLGTSNIFGFFRKIRMNNIIAPANIVAQQVGNFNIAAGFTQAIQAHNVQVVASAGWTGGDVTVTGVTLGGRTVTETITPVANSTVPGDRPIIEVTRLQGTITAGTLDLQWGGKIGLDFQIQKVLKELCDDALDAGGTVSGINGSIIPNTVPNGVHDYDYYFITDENYYE